MATCGDPPQGSAVPSPQVMLIHEIMTAAVNDAHRACQKGALVADITERRPRGSRASGNSAVDANGARTCTCRSGQLAERAGGSDRE